MICCLFLFIVVYYEVINNKDNFFILYFEIHFEFFINIGLIMRLQKGLLYLR